MANNEITDSVLKRHHDQHVSVGGTPVEGSFDRKANDAAVAASAKVGNAASSAASAATAAGSSVAGAASHAADATAQKSGGFLRWLVPLAILAALAWAAFNFLMPGAKDAATDAAANVSDGAAAVTATATDAAAGAADMMDPSAVGDQVSGLFTSATDTLSGITDADSATAALPALGELGTKVDSVSGMLDKLPEAARGPIASIVSGGMGSLQPIIDKVSALPGVGDIITPVIGPIMEKLSGFGT